ncbi:MAG TPA: inositol 2-dehydrogenase [Shinella sp.]|jgi:myo-inositol 2-dehydrogenase/D-chiro-inositol 1-dehydrogenase|uniref:inositol 2-dehydrogenase n=1 Tax=Shinella sp. TaxID=1870904 RepID=UPI002E139602|nr:inositol 2-dehydrogenase [Shinella sp.]
MTRIALLGCGRIGKMHAATIVRAEGAELTAVYDPVAGAAEEIGQRYGCTVAASAEEAIALADAVLIATSTATHADLIEASAKAGKAIFCEKPIDLSLARVVACRQAIAGFERPVQIGFNRRFDPGHRAARDATRVGEIGDLQQVIITSRDPGLASRDYLRVSGGIFRDMTIHDFDLARFMLGEEPVEVFATGSTLVDPTLAEFGDVDSTMIVMRTASGKLCHINNSRAAAYGYDQRVELFGSKGMLISGNRRAHHVERFNATATGAGEPYLDFFIERYVEAFELGLQSFLACAAANTTPDVTFEDGENALVLAEAAIRSKAEGRFVKVGEIIG